MFNAFFIHCVCASTRPTAPAQFVCSLGVNLITANVRWWNTQSRRWKVFRARTPNAVPSSREHCGEIHINHFVLKTYILAKGCGWRAPVRCVERGHRQRQGSADVTCISYSMVFVRETLSWFLFGAPIAWLWSIPSRCQLPWVCVFAATIPCSRKTFRHWRKENIQKPYPEWMHCFRSFPELSNNSLTDTFSSRRKQYQKKWTYRKALHFQRQTIYCCSLSMCSSNRIGTVAHTKPLVVLHIESRQMYRWLYSFYSLTLVAKNTR